MLPTTRAEATRLTSQAGAKGYQSLEERKAGSVELAGEYNTRDAFLLQDAALSAALHNRTALVGAGAVNDEEEHEQGGYLKIITVGVARCGRDVRTCVRGRRAGAPAVRGLGCAHASCLTGAGSAWGQAEARLQP